MRRPAGVSLDTDNLQIGYAVENAAESYHLFKVHSETLELYTPTRGAYYVAGNSEFTLTGGHNKRERGGWFSRLFEDDYPEVLDHYLLVALPPSFVGILGYGSFGWLSAHPTSATSCTIRSGQLALPESGGDDPDTTAFTEAFFAEDKTICETVQRGMGSQLGQGGQLVDMEKPVVDFHQYVATRLFERAATELHYDDAGNHFLPS